MKKVKKFKEYNQEPLMNDLEDKFLDEHGEEFDPSEWEIDQIISILDEDPTKSEDNLLKEAITFDASVPKDIKRGEYIWITSLIKRKGSTNYNDPGRQAVIKLRVVEIFYGLAHLNKVINKK